MQMRHGFASVSTVIDHYAETLGELELFGDLCSGQEEVPKRRLVTAFRFRDTRNGLFGNDEAMNGGLRVDVVNNDAVFVFVFDVCRNLAGNDFLKEGSLAHSTIAA